MASALLTTTLLLLTSSVAHAFGTNGNYSGMIYGDSYGDEAADYIRRNLPYRNGTGAQYPLVYLPFNWTDPAEDNGAWVVRFNTADNWLPGNLTREPNQKLVVTSYALQWSGQETYSNLSAKINNDTSTLRAAGIRQSPPNMCFGMMGFDSDFEDSVKKRMKVRTDDPCTPMLGEECMAALREAFTRAFDDETCSFSVAAVSDVPECEDTWAKKDGFTFLSTTIGNGTEASNSSAPSPEYDNVIAQQVQVHDADDNSTYDKELLRTQFVVLKESGKQAQILCTRFEAAGWRVAAGAGPLLFSVGVVVAMLLEVI